MTDFPLGRREPTDGIHLARYPLRAVMPETVATVERYLTLPVPLRVYFHQRESSCVGASLSQMMALLNRRRYDWRWLWNQAKAQDEWGDTNPGDNNGTSVRAGCDVLRDVGHVRVFRGHASAPNPAEGIAVNRWARNVDEIRSCIAAGVPVVVGTPWHTKMFTPVQRPSGEWWMPSGDLGRVAGGHAYLLEAASDRRQAFRTPNSWGTGWPRTWIPYDLMARLLEGWGEACVVTDR